MASSILKSCFICGLATFLANLMISFIFPPARSLSACLLPGFLFGSLLLAYEKQTATIYKVAFLAISSGLYVLVAWLPTGHNFAWQQEPYIFILASILGAIGLLLAYCLLLNKQLSLKKGLPLAAVGGLLSALIPFAVVSLESQSTGWLSMAGVLSILLSWQTLFGWVLQTVSFHRGSPSDYYSPTSAPSQPPHTHRPVPMLE